MYLTSRTSALETFYRNLKERTASTVCSNITHWKTHHVAQSRSHEPGMSLSIRHMILFRRRTIHSSPPSPILRKDRRSCLAARSAVKFLSIDMRHTSKEIPGQSQRVLISVNECTFILPCLFPPTDLMSRS